MNVVPKRRSFDNSRLSDKDVIADLERVVRVYTAVQPAGWAQDRALGDVGVAADGDCDAWRVGWLWGIVGVCRGGGGRESVEVAADHGFGLDHGLTA